MSEDYLSPETFNFLDVLSGVAYPEDEVTIHTNESLAYQIEKLKELRDSSDSEEEVHKFEALIQEKRAELKNYEYIFHLKGVSQEVREDLRRAAKQKHADRPQEVSGMKIKVPTEDQNDWYETLLIQAQVVKIVQARNGAVDAAPSADVIHAFRKKSPASQVLKLVKAVSALVVSTDKFEDSINETF